MFLEYRTSWFQKHIIHKAEVKSENVTLEQSENLSNDDSGLVGTSITPIDQLDNRIGDWIQIAKEVKILLESLYCSDISENRKYEPAVEFMGIQPVKNSPDKEIIFEITTNFYVGEGCVRVQPSGRIVSYSFAPY